MLVKFYENINEMEKNVMKFQEKLDEFYEYSMKFCEISRKFPMNFTDIFPED